MSDNANKYIGMTSVNNQGYTMTIVNYVNSNNVIVEFDDENKARKHCSMYNFKKGSVRNPFSKSVLGIGIKGDKYPSSAEGKTSKEYATWRSMLKRCYDERRKEKYPTYKDVTCCDEWLYYPNFYEWLHSQENFDKWLNEERWSLDKDIIKKGNKVYSPDVCCLIKGDINALFTKSNAIRSNLPIGVTQRKNGYESYISIKSKDIYLGLYDTPEEAFFAYKTAKEKYIRQVAEEEYSNGNISKKCYEAMMNYEVEITD